MTGGIAKNGRSKKSMNKDLARQMRRIKAEKSSGKTCENCEWYIRLKPLAPKGVCYCSQSAKQRTYVDGKMTCEKWGAKWQYKKI